MPQRLRITRGIIAAALAISALAVIALFALPSSSGVAIYTVVLGIDSIAFALAGDWETGKRADIGWVVLDVAIGVLMIAGAWFFMTL